MANEDSFINEVSEEVRRDRLYATFRRYGWIAVLAVLVLVGGAAWNEWRKASDRAAAEARGDAVIAALEAEAPAARAEALAAIPVEEDPAAEAVIAMLAAAETAAAAGDAAALERLEALGAAPDLDPVYRDLAALKAVMLRGAALDPDARIERLAPLTAPGAPYRPLALEQTAIALAEAGRTEAAVDTLEEIVADAAATEGLRRRATQLIVALGGPAEAS